MRVAVVGAGVMGCATARELARDGHDVVLYEQFEVGTDRGSSHGRSRIMRLAYRDPEWVELARLSFDGWQELEAESGVRLIEWCGLLEYAKEPGHSSHDALAAAGAPFELLTPAQTGARWPVRPPRGWMVLHQPQAGYVRSDLAVRAFLDGASRHGAQLVQGNRIGSLAEVAADAVVVTAGSWVGKLVADLPVRTTRETLAYFRRWDATPLPSVIQRDPDNPQRVMYSLHDPVLGLKAGAHHAGPELDPDEDGGPDPELVRRIQEWVTQTHPDADPRPISTQTCLYTTTADESFILRREGRVVIGSACSGHGFKFAPAVGRRLADLVAEIG